ncbi:MAG: class I SAM-dependent methyltransferase [Planctomycetota bacterium]
MPRFDSSDPVNQVRTHRGTRVYMASHPALRPYMRGARRPQHFGHRLWDASLHLVESLEDASPRTVLDIGCGWGFLGIHLARTCGAAVTCIDLDERLEPIVRAHAELNGVSVPFRAARLSDVTDQELSCDLIVGSDICFSAEITAQLIALVDRASGLAGQVVIGDIGRPDFADLVSHCETRYDCSVRRAAASSDSKASEILTVTFGPGASR